MSGSSFMKTCCQEVPNWVVPVQAYGTGGIIGFAAVDVNGTYLPNCPYEVSEDLIVIGPVTCEGAIVGPR